LAVEVANTKALQGMNIRKCKLVKKKQATSDQCSFNCNMS